MTRHLPKSSSQRSPRGAAARVLSRREERGAAVFVVVLVVTLLTSVGLFAVRNATLSNRASGYNRQLMQTHYVTDAAVTMTVADLKNSLHDAHYILENHPPTGTMTECEAMGQGQLKPKCMILSGTDLNKLYDDAKNGGGGGYEVFRSVGSDNHGSLGPGNLQAQIWVELTDPYETQPPAGYQVAGGAEDTQVQMFSIVTLSATGMVMPAGAFGDATATSAGYERQRARVRMGPILAQK